MNEPEGTSEEINEFDKFRAKYPNISFEELKQQNEKWVKEYPDQHSYNVDFVKDALMLIFVYEEGKPIDVLELGGADCSLALECLKVFPKLLWINLDIVKWKLSDELSKYKFHSCLLLDKHLWEDQFLEYNKEKPFDVFLASDVIEHFSNEQVDLLFNYVLKYKIKYLILKIPIEIEGQDWNGYYGSHIITYGQKHLKERLSINYELLREIGKWNSLWRLK